MEKQISLKDLLSGLIFIGFGLAFGFAAYGYQIGTALRMGPGYFPLVLAGILCLLGVAIVAKGLGKEAARDDLGRVPVRGAVLLLGAIIFFGATIRGLGLVPVLFVTVLLSALASRNNSLLGAVILAAVLTGFCALIFVYGLGVPVALFGPWTASLTNGGG